MYYFCSLVVILTFSVIYTGLVQWGGKKSLVVSAGISSSNAFLTSTEILDLDTLQWTNGIDYPHAIAYAPTVPFGNTFLVVVGGFGGSVGTKEIYEFDPSNNNWIKRSEECATDRVSAFTAFLVPDDAVNCS